MTKTTVTRGSLNEVSPQEWDAVSKPAHYNQNTLETIEVIQDTLTRDEYVGYLWGNIIKYSQRWPHKNGVEDLKKMVWYAQELIDVYE